MNTLKTIVLGRLNAWKCSLMPASAAQRTQPALVNRDRVPVYIHDAPDIPELMAGAWHHDFLCRLETPVQGTPFAHDPDSRQRRREYRKKTQRPVSILQNEQQLALEGNRVQLGRSHAATTTAATPAGKRVSSKPIPIPQRTKPQQVFPADTYGTLQAQASLARVLAKQRHSEPAQLRREDFIASKCIKGCGAPCQSVV